ncbi:hypothetical protein E4U13_000592, partial [Claviceps humidiphila]
MSSNVPSHIESDQAADWQASAWLGDLPRQITFKALELIGQQGLYARAALPSNSDLRPLRPCRNTFTQKYGLPCSHYIFRLMEQDECLSMSDVYPRWWLVKPL